MDSEAIDTVSRVVHGGDTDPDVLDFSANTNPVSPAGTRNVYEAAFDRARRYPDPAYPAFRTAAATYLDWERSAAANGTTSDSIAHDDGPSPTIVPTAGGLVGIRLALECELSAGDSAIVPTPSFSEYAREVRLQGATPTFVDHNRVLDIDPADHALAIVCNPNNPTGEAYDRDRLEQFAARCAATDTTLLVDEAFLDFTRESSMADRLGVVVARSLTKIFGLPGLRAGFLVTTDSLAERLVTAQPTWGLSTPAAAVGEHCLGRTVFVEETIDRVEHERERLADRLADRFEVLPSDAPFLLLEVPDVSVDRIIDRAREHGVAIRDARSFRGLDSHVRVAVKRRSENDRLLEALDV